MSNQDRALASMVAIMSPDRWGTQCVAWVESRDTECGKGATNGFLYSRHTTVAKRRWEKQKAKRQAQEKQRAQHRAQHITEWRAELARIDTELTKRTQPLTTDRAFSGGVGIKKHRKHLRRQFSDANTERVGALLQRRQTLEALIGDHDE